MEGEKLMKRIIAPCLALLAVSTAWAQAGPDARRAALRGTDATVVEVQSLSPNLREIARGLAGLMAEKQVRQVVTAEVGRKFDGDFDVLYRDIANRRVGAAKTFRQALHGKVETVQKRSGGGAAAIDLDALAAALPQLQISIPVGFKTWDPATTAPLVAFAPTDVNDDDLQEVEAYDAAGHLHRLDAKTAPDFPVVVVGLNERTDKNGYLRPEFVRPSVPERAAEKTVAPADDPDGDVSYEPTSPVYSVAPSGACNARIHGYGDQELLYQIKINNNHEPWIKGSPEIYATYSFVDNVGVRGQFNMSAVDNEGQWYTINGPLFYWQSYYGITFIMAVYEQDGSDLGTFTVNYGGFNYTLQIHDGDDSLGSTPVSFNDPNCGYYSTGDSEFYLRNQAATVCGEASCVAAQGAYISHFTGTGCSGTESYYLPYDSYGYSCRSWDGYGQCGTIHRTVTNRSYRYNGTCYDAWPSGNTLNDFVTIYR